MQRSGKKRRKGGRPDQRRGNDRRENRNNHPKSE
jgi:hypothetical protein